MLQGGSSSVMASLSNAHALMPAGLPVQAMWPLQAYELMAPTINDDQEGTTRTSMELKAREHAASLALIHVRNSF